MTFTKKGTIDFIFTHTLTAVQSEQVIRLYNECKVISIEQYPGFAHAAEPDLAIRYLLAYRAETICGYACVKIKKRVMASVSFGPIVADPQDYISVCTGLKRKCRSSGVIFIRIVPPYMPSIASIAASEGPALGIWHSDDEIDWATHKISLDKPLPEIFKSFSEHHRRNIQKAIKLNLKAEAITGAADIRTFAEQYIAMYSRKGIHKSLESMTKSFLGLYTFFRQNDDGYFLVVRSEDGTIVGGICICYQGDSAFYYKGFSDHRFRHLPVSHLALYQAIIYAKEKNKDYFDLGGYATNITESDPVYTINRFKDGFKGDYVIHTRTMLINTVPLAGLLYSLNKRYS